MDDDGLVQVVKPDRKQTSHINKQQVALANTENPDSYWYGKAELVQGRLFPMVKRYDYEKALRIYEQEQKEADLERQE